MAGKNYILDKTAAIKKLNRIALEVIEKHIGVNEIILLGIKENGFQIAKIVADLMAKDFTGEIKVIALELNKRKPSAIALGEQIDFNSKHIVLVDDVANSGKTMMYALRPLLDYHPAKISTLALVERTHKAFPVSVNFVGISLSTTLKENIVVEVEKGIITGAYLE